MRGKPRCRLVTGTNYPVVDGKPTAFRFKPSKKRKAKLKVKELKRNAPSPKAAPPAPANVPTPQQNAKQRLKRDNLLRSELMRERKEIVRKLSSGSLQRSIANPEFCGSLQGQLIDVQVLVREYLEERQLMVSVFSPALLRYIKTCFCEFVRGMEVSQMPLRGGVSLLSQAQRDGLASQLRPPAP